MDDSHQYLQMFLDESAENIQRLSDLCLQLERGDTSDATFAELFRAAHTLKGMSATMGFTQMAHLTHALEDALGFLRTHPTAVEGATVDLLLEAVAGLEETLNSILTNGEEVPVKTELVEGLQKVSQATGQDAQATSQSVQPPTTARLNKMVEGTELGPEVESLVSALQAQGIRIVQLDVSLAADCVMKATAGCDDYACGRSVR